MQTLRFFSSAEGTTTVEDLPLPFIAIDPPMDARIFRRLAKGEKIRGTSAPLMPARGMQALRSLEPQACYWNADRGRYLVFVISGGIEICASAGGRRALVPGDVLLIDAAEVADGMLQRRGDCRLLQLRLADDWVARGALPSPELDSPGDPRRTPTLKRMYKSGDDRSYFRAFDRLFPSATGEPCAARPVRGFWFVRFAPGAFIDWHPEVVNNFVIVLSGALELEVSGDGSIEVFSAGDVCLAEDRTGEGHIDRMHGITRLALIEFEDEHLWGTADE